MISEIRPETLVAGPFENAGHTDFGGIHVTIMRHTKLPRLIALDRPIDKSSRDGNDASVVREWLVDGQPAADLNEAAKRLNAPPTLTDEEGFVLASIPNDWTELSEILKAFTESNRSELSPVLAKLNLKGLIQNKMKTTLDRSVPSIRRTPSTAAE